VFPLRQPDVIREGNTQQSVSESLEAERVSPRNQCVSESPESEEYSAQSEL
jgi:hypothetical protein